MLNCNSFPTAIIIDKNERILGGPLTNKHLTVDPLKISSELY